MRTRLFLPLVALLGTCVAGLPAATSAAPPPRPAASISDVTMTDVLVTSAVSAPVAVSALPDGRAAVLEQGGRVRIVQNGALVPAPALTLSVCSNSERGLLGFAVDPDFGTNGTVYVYYTRPSATLGCVNRVSRFHMSGNTIARNSEVVLLDNIGSPAGNHNGGDVAIGNDGFLYVSVGDGGCSPRDPVSAQRRCAGANPTAQDLSLLNGKILRVNRTTGLPAPGNPFTGAGTAICRTRGNTPSTPTTRCREIFAFGLRNPWRFAFDPNTGGTRFFINDVGQNTREEVDLGIRGANYGWPTREGRCAQGLNPPCSGPAKGSGFVQPLTDYQHGTGSYVTGGAFVPNGVWPKRYDGGYFFADGDPGRIFFRNAAGVVDYTNPFAEGVGGISDIDFVMERGGLSLYYVIPGTNEVRKVTPSLTAAPNSTGLAYHPAAARRVFDSRAAGTISGPLRAGTGRLVNVVATRGTHRAALVNITVLRPSSPVTLSAWMPRTPRPPTAVLNGSRGVITANTAVLPIDADGNVLLFSDASTHVVVDLVGLFDTTAGATAAGRFVPASSQRAVDTRQAPGVGNDHTRTTVGTETVVNVPLAGSFGIGTGTAVSAVVVTVTALSSAAGDGSIAVHPHGGAVPAFSSAFTSGASDARSATVVVPLGADGSIDVRLRGAATQVLVDVVGSFTGAGAAPATSGLYTSAPGVRVLDTARSIGFSRLTAGGAGVLNPGSVPDNALAVVQNVAMVATGGRGLVRAEPVGLASTPPFASVNSSGAGQTRSALTFTRLGAGSEQFVTSVATDLLVDATGWFVP